MVISSESRLELQADVGLELGFPSIVTTFVHVPQSALDISGRLDPPDGCLIAGPPPTRSSRDGNERLLTDPRSTRASGLRPLGALSSWPASRHSGQLASYVLILTNPMLPGEGSL
jgi:hypothetical protein